jgi:hypothetical protein
MRTISPLWWLSCALVTACAGGEVEPRGVDASAPRDVVDVATQQDAPRDSAGDVTDDAPAPDATIDDVVTPPRDGGALCTANRDGVIERSEMAFVLGASVIYAVNRAGTTVDPVDTAGMVTPTGRVWDYAAAVATDQRVLDEVTPPTGQWWSSSYADATFAAVADRATGLLGVYRVSDAALELLGTVSTEQNRTNLRFTPPVAVLRFPLRVGATWSQTVTGAGFLNFTPLTNTTVYTSRIDADGEVWTPAGRFRALRMRTDLDQSIPLTVFRTTRRTYTFVAECWGVIARIASVDNETAEEFRRASEYRRLGL